jgi:predicted alpha/beta superfamily hydrolase
MVGIFDMRMLRRIALVLVVLGVIAATPFAIALWNVASVETRLTLRSGALAMNRRATIYTPAGYDPASPRRYPVLYSLDGQSFRHDRLPATWVRVLSAVGLIEPVIVVAIHNEGVRDIDMRPPGVEPAHGDPPVPGGRDAAFTNFLRDELFPAIDRRYRTSAYRIISGHSLGGFYAVDRLSRSPGLFQAHFAYSPSFAHDRRSLPRLHAAMAMPRPEPSFLYMNIGEEGGTNYLTYFQRAAMIAAVRPAGSQVIVRSERHRGMVHPIVMIPGQARALIWWNGQVNHCAQQAATAAARRACYSTR